jgi:hypothetical protein
MVVEVIEMINNVKQKIKNNMINNNNLIAKIEMIQELKNENKDQKELISGEQSLIEDSYNFEMDSYSNIGQRKACGPMYRGGSSSNNIFSISYSFKHGVDNEKLFFEISGGYRSD